MTTVAIEQTLAERWLQRSGRPLADLRNDQTGYAPMLRDAFIARFGGVLTGRAIDKLIDLVGAGREDRGGRRRKRLLGLRAVSRRAMDVLADRPGLDGRDVDGAEAKRVRLDRGPDGSRGGGGVRTGLHPHDGVARDGLLARRHAGGVPGASG